MTKIPKIDSSARVQRALSRKDFDPVTQEVMESAFNLRKNDLGVSVDLSSKKKLRETAKRSGTKTVITLLVGKIRIISGLDVEHEPILAPPGQVNDAHSEIRGLPHPDNDRKAWELIAGKLVDIARPRCKPIKKLLPHN